MDALINVGNSRQDFEHPTIPGQPGERITIKVGDQQEYRILIKADGSLEIMSEHFINSTLSIRPVVTNIINVKGVER